MRNSQAQRGFTLVELLVVLAIVGILNTLSLQAGLQCIDKTRRTIATLTERLNRLALNADSGIDCSDRPAGSVEARCD